MCKSRLKKALSSAIALVLMSASSLPVHAAAIQKVISASSEITTSASQSQKKIDKIAEQVQEKLMQFRAIEKETAGLDVYNGQIQKQIKLQIWDTVSVHGANDAFTLILIFEFGCPPCGRLVKNHFGPLHDRIIAVQPVCKLFIKGHIFALVNVVDSSIDLIRP